MTALGLTSEVAGYVLILNFKSKATSFVLKFFYRSYIVLLSFVYLCQNIYNNL